MKPLSNGLLKFLVVIALLLNITACATPYKMHPEFKERHKHISSVALMAPEVDAYIFTFQGDKKRLDDLASSMENTTVGAIEKIFSKKGYIMKKLDLTENNLQKNPDLRTSLFNVRKLFDKAIVDISKRKQPKFTYSLGSEVNTFADLADCDMFIFIKEEGLQKSAGEIAKDVVKTSVFTVACLLVGVVAVPIPQTAATIMHVAFVDSNDGAILWYTNNGLNTNWNPKSDKQIFNLIRYLTGPFPDSVFKKKQIKKTTNIMQPSEKAAPPPAKVIMPVPAGEAM